MKNKSLILKLSISLLTLLIFAEIGSFFVLSYLSKKSAVYDSKPVSLSSYNEYLKNRDETLGWPSPKNYLSQGRDLTGARFSPAFPDPNEKSCVSAYGDSFTLSHVRDEYAWANVLAELMDCRVSNYGVGGYGTDQAYLRFLNNLADKSDKSKVVILVHSTENIIRIINQLRDLIYESDSLGLKPRFIISDDGTLSLVPIKSYDYDTYVSAIENPSGYFQYEYFTPAGPSGIQKFGFPYLTKVLGSLNNFRIKAKINSRPQHSEFYDPEHDSEGLEVTAMILKSFELDAQKSDRAPLVVILPMCKDLIYFLEEKRWVYQPLIERLDQMEVDFLNLGTGMIEHLDGNHPVELYWDCSGHLNEKGDRLVANLIFNYINQNNLLNANPVSD